MSTLTRQKYAVLKPDNFKMIPLDCPVCKFFMLKDDDIQYYNEYACCKECAITWAEGPNKEKWKEGWRPADDTVKEKSLARSVLVPRLKL